MFGGDGHLPAAYAGADVRHAVVVADGLVLVVGIALARLRGVPHYLALGLGIGTYQRAAARGRDHLVAVERQHAVAPEGAQHLSAETRAEAPRRHPRPRNAVFVGHLHDAVDAVGHAVERHGHDGLGLAPRACDAVGNGAVECSGSIFQVSGSESTNTGVAPR